MTQHQAPKNGSNDTITAPKIKSKNLTCRILGHDWKEDSLKRTCTRCGKTQVSRFTTNIWVDC